MKKIIYILSVLTFFACGGNEENQRTQTTETTENQTIIPEDVSYEIQTEEINDNLSKNNLEIKLNKKVNKEVLTEIAKNLRSDRKKFNHLYIFYYITDETDGMAWATTHYNPDLEVDILGSTSEEDEASSNTSDIDGNIINQWRSEKSLMGASMTLFEDNDNKFQMRITFKSGSSSDEEVTLSKKNNKTRYDYENSFGEYYLLESNGNLGMYDADGKYDEAIKI